MKKNLFVIALLALPLCAWAGNHKNNNVSKWDKYPLGKVIFTDKDKVSNGAKIYHKIIPNPEAFIQTQAKQVLNTLYYSPKITGVAPRQDAVEQRTFHRCDDVELESAQCLCQATGA